MKQQVESVAVDVFAAALALTKFGYPVLPCRGKVPTTAHGSKEASTSAATIAGWFGGSSGAGLSVGVATGKGSPAWVLDVDAKNGGLKSLAKMVEEHGELPPTVTCNTGGGGVHYYFALGEGEVVRSSAGKVAEGIDVRGSGGYVIAPPSIHAVTKKAYRWADGRSPGEVELAKAPDWLMKLVGAGKGGVVGGKLVALSKLDVAFIAAGLGIRRIRDGKKLVVKCPWQDEHTTGWVGDGSAVVFPPAAGSDAGYFHCSHSHCGNRTQEEVWAALGTTAANITVPGEGWRSMLEVNKKGEITHTPNNLKLIMENDDVRNVYRYDVFRHAHVVAGQLPAMTEFQPHFNPGTGSPSLDTPHAVELAAYIYVKFRVKLTTNAAFEMATCIAEANRYSSLVDHIEGLKWDGELRLDRWLSTYYGAADTEYNRTVGKLWLLQAMQRAYEPGCLVYGCLVLEGEQGTGKSYGLSVIGGEYYSDNMPQMNDTRGVVELLGDKWILEISELAAMKKSEVEMVKAFLTRTHDRARMAYARTVSMHPRSCVFAGSTNDSSYLEDTTGNRRFWPVTIGRLGFRELEKDRDALLAEARDVYKWQKGDGTLKTWLPDSLLRDQVAKTAERMTVDPFVFEIEEFAKGRDAEDGGVSVRDILTNCLSIPLGQQSQTHSRRVCRALAFLGYEKKVEGQGRGGGAKVKWTKASSF